MKDGRVGVGVIGAGEWAGTHAHNYGKFPGLCGLVAFADPAPGRAAKRAREFGAKKSFTDFREMLGREDIELVSIATPPSTHAELAVAAFEAGKHVLCEKPLAGSLAECDAMIAAARKAGRVLAGVFQNRFYRNIRQAKALIESGCIGKPVLASLAGLWWRGPEYYAVPWRGTWEGECGGTLLNHHSHLLDAALYLMGDSASRVFAEMDTLTRPADVEDTAAFVMRLKGGGILSAMATAAAEQGEIARIELGCERGGLSVELYGRGPLRCWCAKSGPTGFPARDVARRRKLERLAGKLVPPGGPDALATIVRNAVLAARGEETPLVPAEDARRAVEHVFAVYKSANTGQPVMLPLAPDDPFYTREGILRNVRRGGRKPR